MNIRGTYPELPGLADDNTQVQKNRLRNHFLGTPAKDGAQYRDLFEVLTSDVDKETYYSNYLRTETARIKDEYVAGVDPSVDKVTLRVVN